MAKRYVFCALFLCTLACLSAVLSAAQDAQPSSDTSQEVIRVNVNLVQLNVAVTDNKGNYVTGLRPQDFAITEDRIPQTIATFEEGNSTPQILTDAAQPAAQTGSEQFSTPSDNDSTQHLGVALAGADVFVLFDTSDYMYLHQGFVLAQDAIADFLRSLDSSNRVAFYSSSRNISREARLTSNREDVLRGVRESVAGDDAALYNALLVTLKDAGQFTGRRVVVVFSNGPDNASVISPEVVGELAQSEGVPIYMICTREAQEDPMSTAIFERMSASTGGKAFFAGSWTGQQRAFAAVRDDLAHLYSLSYYPQQNPNHGWRAIKVTLVGDRLRKYHIRTRSGYRPIPAPISEEAPPAG